MSRTRAKGTSYETSLVNYLNEQGFENARRTGSAAYGDGDIVGVPFLTIEAKNVAKMDLSGWLDQVTKARDRSALGAIPVVFHKRRGKNVAKSYVTLSLDEFLTLMPRSTNLLPNE